MKYRFVLTFDADGPLEAIDQIQGITALAANGYFDPGESGVIRDEASIPVGKWEILKRVEPASKSRSLKA